MVWREGKYHGTDCYFCMTDLRGVNKKNKHLIKYPDVPSAIKPLLHNAELPIPSPTRLKRSRSSSVSPKSHASSITDSYTPEFGASNEPLPSSRTE